jgi:hypothetical protein
MKLEQIFRITLRERVPSLYLAAIFVECGTVSDCPNSYPIIVGRQFTTFKLFNKVDGLLMNFSDVLTPYR